MKNANANLMKEINLNNVRQVMKRAGTATKPQLAALTKLSVVTVNSLVKELVESDEMIEDQTIASGGGRPALTYRFNYDHSQALVIYLKENQGQRVASAAVINLENRTVSQQEYVLPAFEQQYFAEIISSFLIACPQVKVIGMGIPGQIVNGRIVVASHQELEGAALIEELEQQFQLPVIVENDVNAAVFGYQATRGEADGQSITGIYFPKKYPPGMGIYLNGTIIRGKNGMAGEIKFLPHRIDWYAERREEVLLEAASRIIQSVNAVLAPDQIVVYQEITAAEQWLDFWKSYQAREPMPHDPEVILSNTFQADYEAGMRRLTLQRLDPEAVQF
ncbi:transcriptional regulator [Paenibacillus sp. FSL R7-0273]|uniref:ROK family transcriptional regulator n=1 Tax=Paenibacillus sp. FSL R7-0273 TaxID=1536772 RepID=UPI0004F6774B|nr:ROK family protein [Paenibacillus sp. FSL R7-0273]AIQ47291.1 transcriptional regulator [Paenibacillus sp. FSL R7-0273]OMF91607.1 transcriptional regulator [Paenibacillus sp. FSL R7-0273]